MKYGICSLFSLSIVVLRQTDFTPSLLFLFRSAAFHVHYSTFRQLVVVHLKNLILVPHKTLCRHPFVKYTSIVSPPSQTPFCTFHLDSSIVSSVYKLNNIGGKTNFRHILLLILTFPYITVLKLFDCYTDYA